MPIVPDLGTQYLGTKDQAVLEYMQSIYTNAYPLNQSFQNEAQRDINFYCGNQQYINQYYNSVGVGGRQQFQFNLIRRLVDMTVGFQRRNRKSTVAIPISNADEETADQYTKVLMWIDKNGNHPQTISDAFQSSCITGMSFLHLMLDWRTDPINGDLRMDMVPYNEMIVDPFFRQKDMSDCSYFWRRGYVNKKQAMTMFDDPEAQKEIKALSSAEIKDQKFPFMPEAWSYQGGYRNLLTYDQFYYRDFRTQKFLVDSQTGEQRPWNKKDPDELRFYLQTFPQVTVIESQVPTINLAIVVQGRVMYHGAEPQGLDNYPIVPVLNYFHPELPNFENRIFGMVRGMKDPQFLFNRFMVTMANVFESQVTTGWVAKENAVVNPKDLVSKQGEGHTIFVKESAQMTDLQKIEAPNIPPGLFQLSDMFSKLMMDISGSNEELMGSAVDEKAGILAMLRQGAGLTVLQTLFDQLDHSQEQIGELKLEIIQKNWTPAKIKAILEGAEPSPQFYDQAFGVYGCAVVEGLNTTTQKQQEFAQLLQLREMGINIPDDVLIESATVQNKKQLKESLANAQQQRAQMEQQAQESAIRVQEAQMELAKARSISETGLGLERVSRVQENSAMAQRQIAESHREEAQAALDIIKAAKELEGIDIGHIKEIVGMFNQLKAQELAEKQHDLSQQQMAMQSALAQNNQPTQQSAGPGR